MARVVKIDNAVLKRREYKKRERRSRLGICRILIVCEGVRTEPDYFRAFNKIQRGSIVYEVTTGGGGINTMNVVDEAIKQRAIAEYDSVWAVFDKDDFTPDKFNGAIVKARDKGINCAWSNQAFELWYLLHFHNRVTAMHRDDYKKAISDAVNKKRGTKDYKYAKNDAQNYQIVTTHGCQEDAIQRAESLHKNCTDEKYHTHNPCTLVYKLVLQLIGKDKELNEAVSAKMEE